MQLTGLCLGLLGDLKEVAKGGVSEVVAATGPFGAGGWGSAPRLVLRGFGGFGSQGFLVLPPFLVPLLVPSRCFSFLGDVLLLLPCSVRSFPSSQNSFSIMSHIETLIVAPDGYSLGFSSSSILSGRSPWLGLSRWVQTLKRFWRKR